MPDTGNEHGVVKMIVDRVAAAVDQHGGNGAGIAGQYGADARIDVVAHVLDDRIGALQRALRLRRRDDLD